VQTVTTRRALPAVALIQPISSGSDRASPTPPRRQQDHIDGFAGVSNGAATNASPVAVLTGFPSIERRDVVSAVGQQRCAGEDIVWAHHIECLHAGKTDDHHLRAMTQCWPDNPMSSTPSTPPIRTWT